MIQIREHLKFSDKSDGGVTLTYDKRQKSRLRVELDDGAEAAIILPRGTILRDGDFLRSKEGMVIQVCAALEEVSTVFETDSLTLARASYHLGNRHVPLQIGNGWVRYQKDHVLDHMVESLGLKIKYEMAPFEPEAGAYGAHNHSHSHNNES